MSATNSLEDALLALLFNNTNTGINIGDATGLRGSSTAGNFFVSLHTASPNEGGSQTTSEAAYTNYARQSTNRASGAGGWTVTGGSGLVVNASAITFPTSGNGPETESHFGIGGSLSGVGNLYLYGALTANLVVNNLVQPNFAAGNLSVTLD